MYDDKIVVNFLKFGWPINCNTTVLPKSTLQNHGSAAGANGKRMDCVISPLQCVPKRDSTEPYKLTLPGIDQLVEFVNRLGRGCRVFKKDLKRAYRQIPVDPADYHLLGMCISGSFYFHMTLPFGLQSATMACQRTTKVAAHILNSHGILADVYINDFYGTATPETSLTDFACMNRIFSELGLQASPDKDIPPSCEMTCLGVHINTVSMTLTVPEFRLHELQEELNSWSNDQFCRHKYLQRLLGK